MRTRQTILFFSPTGRPVPDTLLPWITGKQAGLVPVSDPAVVQQMVLRALPLLVLVDADSDGAASLELCTRPQGRSVHGHRGHWPRWPGGT